MARNSAENSAKFCTARRTLDGAANSFWIPGREQNARYALEAHPGLNIRRCIPQADLVTLLSSREFSKEVRVAEEYELA